MEHHPYLTLNDGTEITYSDLKKNKKGEEYVTIYFETPCSDGFRSAQIDYPNGSLQFVTGYTQEDEKMLLYHYHKIGSLVFQFAKGEV